MSQLRLWRTLGAAAVIALALAVVLPGIALAKDKVKGKIDGTTLTITGTGGAETVALRLHGGDPTTLDIDVGNDGFVDLDFKRDKFDHIVVDARGGDDAVLIDETNGVFTNTELTTVLGGAGDDTVNGGSAGETYSGGAGNDTISAGQGSDIVDGDAGNDTISGSIGADVLRGGDDNDTLTGGDGDDQLFGSAGDDRFVWNPGDDSDTVEGEDGTDTLAFNGANIAERFEVSPNGGRVRFTRDIASIVLDLDGVELVDVNALGGADTLTVDDLTGTDVSAVSADLAATLGGATGDAAADTVIVNGTAAADTISVSGSGTSASVTGLSAQVNIANAEGAIDALLVSSLGGVDSVNATGLPAGTIKLTVDGGPGDDVSVLSPGDDVFQWDPGDGNDIVEGQAGTDRLAFNGAVIAEHIDLSANGSRALLLRDVANITMDLNDIEVVDVNALGGADTINVGNLSGTDLTLVRANLAAVVGGTTGDGQPDTVDVTGTGGSDVVVAAGDASGVSVSGLPAAVQITGADAAIDVLSVHALGGDDVLDGSGLAADATVIHAFGGDGDDVLLGGEGDDSLFGEEGDDVLIGNGGNDVLDGGPGNNIIIQ